MDTDVIPWRCWASCGRGAQLPPMTPNDFMNPWSTCGSFERYMFRYDEWYWMTLKDSICFKDVSKMFQMISMPNEYNVRISYNHISGLKPPIKCCNNLWIVYNIVSSSWCSFLRVQIYIEAWGVGSWSQRCSKAEAQHYWHGVLLCKASSFVLFLKTIL